MRLILLSRGPSPILSAAGAAVAAWLSQGTLGFADASGARLGLLPTSSGAGLLPAVAGALCYVAVACGSSPAPLMLLALLVLPWLPIPIPAAFLLWSGPLSLLVWAAVGLLMAGPRWRRLQAPVTSRPAVWAGVLALAIFGFSAWRVAPSLPGGDEPHYLIITQSLLVDHDLRIQNNHQRRDYRAYYAGELAPHVQQRGRNGEIYSIHAPGLSLLVAPAFAVAGYRGVVVFLVLLAAAGSALVWHTAWLATRRDDAAWFAWLAVTLSATAIFHSFTVYPDGVGGVLTLAGLWALLRADEEARSGATSARPWLLHGVALSLLPWMHSRFALLAGTIGALVLLKLSATKNPAAKAVAFLSVPTVSALLWIGYFIALYGRPDPAAPYAAGEIGSFVWVPGGLGGLLFDQRFGLLAYAPVLAFGFVGLGMMLIRAGRRRLALELLFVMTPYLLTVTHFAMWWGGWSPPARFFVPVLPLLAVPLAVFFAEAGRVGRVLAGGAALLTVFASAVLVLVSRGRLAFNVRDTPALWLEWLGTATDLVAGAPSWSRATNVPLFRTVLVWIAAATVAGMVVRALDRAGRLRSERLAAAVAGALAIAAMAALTIIWRVAGVDGRHIVSAQVRLLGAASSAGNAIAIALDPPERVARRDLVQRMTIALTRNPAAREPARNDRGLFAFPSLPAGTYRLRPGPESRGSLMFGIAPDQFSILTAPVVAQGIDLRLPVGVRALIVRGDDDARQSLRGLILEPASIVPPAGRLTPRVAARAARYDGTVVFFLDDLSFPEPSAFWVRGARTATVVLQPDAGGASAAVSMRNGAVQNRVRLQSGEWRLELPLAPGEERRVDIPLAPSAGAALLTIESESGFRPSEHDPASRDDRYLGVWVRPG